MTPDERSLRELHAAMIDAVNAGDVARVLGLMADDVVLLGPGQPPVGRDAFPAGFTGAHAQARIHCTSELDDLVVVGDVAHALSRDALTVTPRAGGEATRLAGHRLTVYRRQADGRWLVARDAHTLSPVAPTGA